MQGRALPPQPLPLPAGRGAASKRALPFACRQCLRCTHVACAQGYHQSQLGTLRSKQHGTDHSKELLGKPAFRIISSSSELASLTPSPKLGALCEEAAGHPCDLHLAGCTRICPQTPSQPLWRAGSTHTGRAPCQQPLRSPAPAGLRPHPLLLGGAPTPLGGDRAPRMPPHCPQTGSPCPRAPCRPGGGEERGC